jgi:hypothetical protein
MSRILGAGGERSRNAAGPSKDAFFLHLPLAVAFPHHKIIAARFALANVPHLFYVLCLTLEDSMTFDDPIKQEIWNTVRALNVAWTKGNPDNLVRYFHPQMLAVTATDRLRLEGRDVCIAAWKKFAEAAVIHRWVESEPLIEVYGSAAVVAYYYSISFAMNGQHFESGGRDMYVLVREDGRWLAVADQFSPYPPQN